jgi:MFS family permease
MHMKRYASILCDGACARPLVASLIGRIPEGMISVAFVLVVHQSTGSYTAAGLATGGYAAGAALSGPLAGRALDRVGGRAALVPRALVFAAALVLLGMTATRISAALMIGLAVSAGLGRPPLESAMRALWPSIVPARRLQAAYTLDAVGQDLIWLGAPLLLSALLVVADARAALVVCGGCTLLGALGYAAAARPPATESRPQGEQQHARLGSLAFRSALAAAALYGISMGTFEIALTVFCNRHDAQSAVGVLLAVWSVGSLTGGLLYGTHSWKLATTTRLGQLLSALTITLAALAAAGPVWLLGILLFMMGMPTAPFTGTLNAAVNELASPQRHNEAFTWVTAMVTSGIAVGNSVGGPVIQLDPELGFPLAAAAAAAAALLALGGRRAISQ